MPRGCVLSYRRCIDRERAAGNTDREPAPPGRLLAGVPLVPVAIRGADRWQRLGRWEIAFGAPVRLDDLADLDAGRAARVATERLWDEIVRLERELRGGGGAAPD